MKRLSAAQRTAIRDIADGKPVGNSRTLACLVRRRLATIDGETMAASLTRLGRTTYDRIMESGDGPEDLKELLRFR